MLKLSTHCNLLILFFSILIINSAYSVPNMKLNGVLLESPSCIIESGKVIDIPFGENLGVHKVNGVNYSQKINYTLKCEKNTNNWDLKLSILGPKSDFDSSGLQTNINDLAIRIMQNNIPLEINKKIKIDALAPPKLSAVPIKRPGSTLSEGDFFVYATLLAEYE
ncbi:fimbrial protein [Providencia rettgeri]|uniref:fimbrial protein n=1 Tax=Providencia rettgeri TaxID=587 RepID=UPI0006901DB3|nr:fimbrial protein [Providencia rettgeri]